MTPDKTTLQDVSFIDIPSVNDPRGNLAILEKDTLPFAHKRVYYLFDVPSNSTRGGHSHINQHGVLIAISGSFTVVVDDGKERRKILLNKPLKGLHIPPGIWRELEDFSSGAICLVMASDVFTENDYIRDYNTFTLSKG